MIIPSFNDINIQTLEDFYSLASHSSLVFYEVYSVTPCTDFEAIFDFVCDDELFVKFDMNSHSQAVNDFFVQLMNLNVNLCFCR